MGVVLDDSPGERVLLYGADGAVLRQVVVDAAGHLQVDVLSALEAVARLYGYDGTDWQNLLVESATLKNLRVVIGRGDTLAHVAQHNADGLGQTDVGLMVEAFLRGFNGTTWDRLRSDALRHLYVNQFGVPGAESKSDLSAAAGTDSLSFTAVATAKVQRVTNIWAGNFNTVNVRINLMAGVGGVMRVLVRKASPAVVEGVNWQGECFLAAGDYIYVEYEGCTLNDDLYADIHYVVLDA